MCDCTNCNCSCGCAQCGRKTETKKANSTDVAKTFAERVGEEPLIKAG